MVIEHVEVFLSTLDFGIGIWGDRGCVGFDVGSMI